MVPQRNTFAVVEVGGDRSDLVRGLARLRWLEWNHWHPWRDQQWWAGAMPASFVAVGDGEVVGGLGVAAVERPDYADRGPWLVGVVVRTDRRGQGVGTALIAGVVGWARENGIPHLWVSTGGRPV